jgi:hypothetical protein
MRRLVPIALLAAALAAPASGFPAPTPKPKSHGNALSGTVVRVDETKKLLVVRAGSRETTLVMTPATSVHGGPLAGGQRVAVRWLEKDGRKVATSVRIEPASVAGAAATPTAVNAQP